MSELVTNKITPATGSSDTVTLGDSGDTFTIPAGVTLAGSGASLTALPAANLTGSLPAISGASLTNLPPSAPSHRNDIINGGLVVNQENQTAPADDAYTIGDLFLHVGEGTPVMSLETDGPQGVRPWQKMVLDVNAQGGLVYFMSNDDVQDYIANGKLSFGIQLKTTAATIANARIGILKWVGTADAVTSDVVGTWASDGTNPTLATSWSYENTPANIGLTTSWARHTVEDVTVDSDTKNIAIFIWTDDGTITASDVIGFSEWQCNPGSTVHAFSSPIKATVKDQISYHLQRWNFDQASTEHGMMGAGHVYSTSVVLFTKFFDREMRITPSITSSGTGTFQAYYRVSQTVFGALAAGHIGKHGCRLTATAASGAPFTVGDAVDVRRDGTDVCFIMADARH
jgi:hypothetical protein